MAQEVGKPADMRINQLQEAAPLLYGIQITGTQHLPQTKLFAAITMQLTNIALVK